MEKKFKDLNLNSSFLFAAALNDPETCQIVLELILGKPIPKVNVKTEHNILLSTEAKCVRLDVNARSEYDVNYNIEAQNKDEGNIVRRSRFYQAELDIAELKPGDNYNNLPDSFVIFICTFDPFGRGLYRYTFTERCEENGEPLGDGTCKIFLNTKGTNSDDVPRELLTFLGYYVDSSDEYVKKADNKSINKLHNKIITLKKSREWEDGYMKFEELLSNQEHIGFKKGTANSIITILSTKGEVTEDIKEIIESETDINILNAWLTKAASVGSIKDFKETLYITDLV